VLEGVGPTKLTNLAEGGVILAVRKPAGISSFTVVRKIRGASGVKRVGHAGTLDPFAEGLLVVGIGRSATKLLSHICDFDKEYIGTVTLGSATDTGDPTGKVISESPVPPFSESELMVALGKFSGTIMQIPPIYSAIQIDGKRLYKLARKGIEIDRPARPVNIYQIEPLEVSGLGFLFRVVCSKGTYIRVLAEDIARELGTVGHLSKLVRTRIGEYSLGSAEDLLQLTRRLEEERRPA